MRTASIPLVLLGLSMIALPAATAAGAGPVFAGSVEEGETNTHRFSAGSGPCVQIAVTYTVQLTHVPTDAVLVLEAREQSTTVTGGTGAVSVTGSPCSSFPIQVTGESVEDTATYTITVTRSAGGSLVAWS